MGRKRWTHPIVLALVLLGGQPLAGCGDDVGMAAAPPSAGGAGTSGARPAIAAPTAGDDDGGVVSPRDGGASSLSPLARECEDVEDVGDPLEGMATAARVNAITAPTDMTLGRVLTTWEGACDDPTLRISMSNGRCPDGDGHELSFRIDVADVRDGTVGLGQNPVAPRDDGRGMEISYTRPARFSPRGEWGNCTDAIGIVDLVGDLSLEEGTSVQARFQLELTACDDSGNEAMLVNGEFNGVLERGAEDLCP